MKIKIDGTLISDNGGGIHIGKGSNVELDIKNAEITNNRGPAIFVDDEHQKPTKINGFAEAVARGASQGITKGFIS